MRPTHGQYYNIFERALPSVPARALTGLALLASYVEKSVSGLTRLRDYRTVASSWRCVALQMPLSSTFMHHYDVTLMNRFFPVCF